ncbi:MAG: hypothetical protein EXR29_12530 [Betaproteobacteria bacterium]|nr:hypothetical protein [Betaproteobacteria bacterium]
MTLEATSIDPAALKANNRSGYPEPFRSLVLVTDAGEQALKAGQCAGFPAGLRNGHQLVNRGSAPAVYLEISNRDKSDAATYPDVDLRWNAPDVPERYSHKDGRPY